MKLTVSDEHLDQFIQGRVPGGSPTRRTNTSLTTNPNTLRDRTRYHFRVPCGTVDGKADSFPQFLELFGELAQAVDQVLERGIHGRARMNSRQSGDRHRSMIGVFAEL